MYNFQGVYVLDCQVKMLSNSSEYCYTQLSFLDSLVKAEPCIIYASIGSLASAAAMHVIVHNLCPDHFWVLYVLAPAISL